MVWSKLAPVSEGWNVVWQDVVLGLPAPERRGFRQWYVSFYTVVVQGPGRRIVHAVGIMIAEMENPYEWGKRSVSLYE